MSSRLNPNLAAVLQALLVTFIWSTSWVLVKFGLEDIPPVTFAALRYLFGFLFLIPFYLRSTKTVSLRQLARRDWSWLLFYGLLYYTLTQGSQFIGLLYLPAILFSFVLNFTAPLVALSGVVFLKEKLSRVQWVGMLVFLVGVVIFFYPVALPAGLLLGLGVAAVHVLGNVFSSITGRFINRQHSLDPLTVTLVSMGAGALGLLAAGLASEPFPVLDLGDWLLVLWLALVNTSFAFYLWNHTLRTLTAAQSSIINNTMLIQIAILAWIFLGETVTLKEGIGMAVVLAGVVMVNLRRR
jgi:drug/metabolite transporter (DMT)-like permease